MTRKELIRLNVQREKQGLEPFANPRFRHDCQLKRKMLDPKLGQERRLSLFCLWLGGGRRRRSQASHHELLDMLRQNGFPVNPHIGILRYDRRSIEVHRYLGRKTPYARLRNSMGWSSRWTTSASANSAGHDQPKPLAGWLLTNLRQSKPPPSCRGSSIQVGKTGAPNACGRIWPQSNWPARR